MLETLIKQIETESISYNPDLKTYADLKAAITHWLYRRDTNFHKKTNQLVELWEEVTETFCKENQTNIQEVLSPHAAEADHNFNFVDLFAGIGGFRLALEEHGGQCVFSSEWDKSAKMTYFKNHGEFPFGDINTFTGEHISDDELDKLIPTHDILAGGFPCQPFSNAGVSARNSLGHAHGFECKTQGTLFHSIARIAYVKQPTIVFMENVKNIVGHNGGETFSTIKNTMENLAGRNNGKQNYRFFYSIANSESVVPQRRVRCYMVCIREDIWQQLGQTSFVFPEFDGTPRPLREALEELTDDEINEYTISDRLWQGHINRSERNINRGTGFTAYEANLDRPSNTIVARYGKDGKECLIPQDGKNPRKLTRRECANLFGYPQNFWIPPSKTPAYKQFGNSVVVPVVTAIAGNIINFIRPVL